VELETLEQTKLKVEGEKRRVKGLADREQKGKERCDLKNGSGSLWGDFPLKTPGRKGEKSTGATRLIEGSSKTFQQEG